MMAASAAFCNDDIMGYIKPGDHGSTYGGNPLAMRVAQVAIQTMIEEQMPQNAAKMGEIFNARLSKLKSRLIKQVRGRGLFQSIEIDSKSLVDGNDFAYELMKNGLLTKATHVYSLRLAPALTINEKQIAQAVNIIRKSLTSLAKVESERRQIRKEERSKARGESEEKAKVEEVKNEKTAKKEKKEKK